MSAASAGRFLARVPGIAWVGVLVIAVASAGVASIYTTGKRAGKLEVHRVALADTTARAVATVARATAASDRQVAAATTRRAASADGRARVRDLARDLAASLDSAPAPIVRLVEAQADQITADSLTISVQGATIDSLLVERVARQALDTARVHTIALEADDDGGRALPIALVVGLAAAAIALWQWTR